MLKSQLNKRLSKRNNFMLILCNKMSTLGASKYFRNKSEADNLHFIKPLMGWMQNADENFSTTWAKKNFIWRKNIFRVVELIEKHVCNSSEKSISSSCKYLKSSHRVFGFEISTTSEEIKWFSSLDVFPAQARLLSS